MPTSHVILQRKTAEELCGLPMALQLVTSWISTPPKLAFVTVYGLCAKQRRSRECMARVFKINMYSCTGDILHAAKMWLML